MLEHHLKVKVTASVAANDFGEGLTSTDIGVEYSSITEIHPDSTTPIQLSVLDIGTNISTGIFNDTRDKYTIYTCNIHADTTTPTPLSVSVSVSVCQSFQKGKLCHWSSVIF